MAMKGLFYSKELTLVSKKKNLMEEGKSYYFDLGFTDGEDLIKLTAGVIGDKMEIGHQVQLGVDYLDKKLKIRDFVDLTVQAEVVNAGLEASKKGGK